MRRAWVGLALLGVAMTAGCDAPTRPEHTTRLTQLVVTAAVQADGNAAMRAEAGYPTDDGGVFRAGAPTLGTISGVTLDGSPRTGGGEHVDVNPRGTHPVVEWQVNGAAERYSDGAIVTIPVWTPPPSDVNGDDKRVPIKGTVQLPAAPTGTVHWHGASPASISTDGNTITFEGEVDTTTPSALQFLVPAEAVAAAPVLPGASRVSSFENRQVSADGADAQLARDIADDKRREDLTADMYWALVVLEIAIPFLITLIVIVRSARLRERAVRDAPDELSEPPSDLAPAVVSLLYAGGHDIGDDAVAATVLDLAQRKTITLDGISGQRYTIKVNGSSNRPGEAALLAELAPHGEVVGPPLPADRNGRWWKAMRRDVSTIARSGGLLRRRYPSGLFLTAVVALAITTIPLYARSPETLVAGFVVASILAALPFVGGFVLTAEGHRQRAQWQAYRRHLTAADLDDVDPAGVIIWERALVYAAALGVATTAIGELS